MRTEMLNLVYVGVGGLLGSIGRYLVTGAVYQIFPLERQLLTFWGAF